METPRLSFQCHNTACRAPLHVDLSPDGPNSVDCSYCKKSHPLRHDEALSRDGRLTKCTVCDGSEFFVRKDFPQRLGMALVILFGLTGTVFYYYRNIPASFGTLAALVVVDAVIYFFVGTATVCYRCRAEYRRLAPDLPFRGFDLATSEKYDVTA